MQGTPVYIWLMQGNTIDILACRDTSISMVFPCKGNTRYISMEHHSSLAREHHISMGSLAREHQYIYGVPLQEPYIYGVPLQRDTIDILALARERHRYTGPCKGTPVYLWCSLARDTIYLWCSLAREHQYIYGFPLQGNTIDIWLLQREHHRYTGPCKGHHISMVFPCRDTIYLWCSIGRPYIYGVPFAKGHQYIYGVPLEHQYIYGVPLQREHQYIYVFPCKGTP